MSAKSSSRCRTASRRTRSRHRAYYALALILAFFQIPAPVLAQRAMPPKAAPVASVTVSGTVTDGEGHGIPSVAVRLIRSGAATVSGRTDGRGRYTLSAEPGAAVLVIGRPEIARRAVTVSATGATVGDVVAYRSIASVRASGLTSDLTGNDLPVRDQALTVIAVPRDVLDTRAVVRLDQSVDTVSNVQRLTGFGTETAFQVRGIAPSAYNTFRDGFRQSNTSSDDIIAVDRVDVLKGPAAALLGSTAPLGGTVDVISKRPPSTPLARAELEAGSFADERVALDVGGPIDGARKLRFRFSTAYDRGNSYRDFVSTRSVTAAPSLSWSPTANDTFTLLHEEDAAAFTFDQGYPLGSPLVLEQPPSRFAGEPGDRSASQNRSTTLLLDHRLSARWRVVAGANTDAYNIDIAPTRWYTASYDPTGRILTRSLDLGPQSTLDRSFRAQLRGEIGGAAVQQHLTFGAETTRSYYYYVNNLQNAPPIDITNPQYGPLLPGITAYANGVISSDDVGFAFNDVVSVPHFDFSLGVRDDIYDQGSAESISKTAGSTSGRRASPRFGLVYKPDGDNSMYADYAEGISPQVGISRSGLPFDPVLAHQVEVGFRRTTPGFTGSIAAYHILTDNLLTTDPTNANYSIATGRQQSRGIEVDLLARPLPRLVVTTSYALSDAKVVRDTSLPSGSRVVGVPLNSGSVWSTYDFGAGPSGVLTGIGVIAQSRREVSLPNSFSLPSTARLNALLGYRTPRGTLQLNLDNLTNVTEFQTDGGYSLLPLAPATLRLRWIEPLR